MSNMIFRDFDPTTPITASWLNDVGQSIYGQGAGIGAGAVAGQMVNSIAALRLLSKLKSPNAFVLGYYGAHDGGGGSYSLDPADVTSTDNGGTLIVANDGGRWKLNWLSRVSVKQFGAKGDGATDDTAAISAADAWARSVGAQLYFPASTYMASRITGYTNSNWLGDGRQATIFLQKVGSNQDFVYGNNSAANWGSGSPTNVVVNWQMRGITINGNWNNGAGNTSGSGLAMYGARPIWRDIFITNCAEWGIRTEYLDEVAGIGTFTMEGHMEKIQIDTVGKDGWWNKGPHDSTVLDMTVVDAGQSLANTYSGFLMDAQSTGGYTRLHAWTRSSSVRAAWGVKINPGAQADFVACHFEGAWLGNVGLFSQNCTFDSTCHYYSAWNGVNFYMGGTCTVNVIRGVMEGPGVGRPASIGILMGSVNTDFIGDNIIDVKIDGNEAGNIVWSGGGVAFANNRVRALCYNTTSATYSGTISPTDDVDMMFHSNGVTSHVNNLHQNGQITVPATSSATWTFPIAFSGNPFITFSPIIPSGSLTSGMWVSSLSATSVTIFNNNSVSTPVSIRADSPS